MSDKRKGSNKVDKQETPDSTTKFFEGEEVFVQNSDEFVLGQIKEIDLAAEKCLISIESGETLWAVFKDLKPWTIDVDESPVKCNLCKCTQSKKNNLVVSCEICFRGYHQKCHQPVIESADTSWICKKCRRKQNCQSLANTVTQKTVSPTSKNPSLPSSYENISYNGKKRCCRNIISIQGDSDSFKGQRLCIKSASPPFCADAEQRKSTSKVKKRSPPVENKNLTASSISDTLLPELPPTPPSSISAPETPQPSIVNGEQPTSPKQDLTCVDFNDVSPPTYLATCNLQELLDASKEPTSDITLPLQLDHVIVDPLIRPTKRHLSEKDFKIVNGVIVKKRRRRKQSSAGVRAVDSSLLSISKLHKSGSHTALLSPVKTLPNDSAADLKTLVYSYFGDETKRVPNELHRFVCGEEYRICGKRHTLDGRVQYLVEWVKCTDPL